MFYDFFNRYVTSKRSHKIMDGYYFIVEDIFLLVS